MRVGGLNGLNARDVLNESPGVIFDLSELMIQASRGGESEQEEAD